MKVFSRQLVIGYLIAKVHKIEGEIRMRRDHLPISRDKEITKEIIRKLEEEKIAFLDAIELIRGGI